MNVPRMFWLVVLVLPLILVGAGAGIVFAQGSGPTEVEPAYLLVGGYDDEPVYVFEVGGRTCVRVGDQLECFCECTLGCDGYPTAILMPTSEGTPPPPNGTPTPTPETTPTPRTTSTPPPSTATPGPNPTPEKEKCNRGIGNLDEDCDPGNSSGQGQGDGRPAGEDRHEGEGPPGN